jgi:hypothetical protein
VGKKTRMNTRKHLHAARKRAALDRKTEDGEDSGFRYRHEAEMRKLLKGVDHARFAALTRRPEGS